MPEGEGLAGQHGKPGYILFLGLLARPWLMVAGFFISYMLMGLIGPYVAQGFSIATAGMNSDFVTGLIEVV
jgi:conjugal transfer/type IV secretion protein DotA/TraY